MNIIIIGGFLGSGKTTTILNIGKYYSIERKEKVGIIVNEIGDVGIDGDIINQYGLNAKEITSGCICCSLKVSLRETLITMISEYKPDIIIIEPTGIAFPNQIKNEINLMNLSQKYQMFPLITLVDCGRFKQIFKGLNKFLVNQLKDTDIVILNKIDLVDDHNLEMITESIKQINSFAKIIHFSNNKPAIVQKFIKTYLENNNDNITQKNSGNCHEFLAYSSLKSNENINSIKESNIFSYSTKYDFIDLDKHKLTEEITKAILFNIIKNIKSELKLNEFIGHIKLYINNSINTYKLSIISNFQDPVFEKINYKSNKCFFKILFSISSQNINYFTEKKIIHNIIQEEIINVFKLNNLTIIESNY